MSAQELSPPGPLPTPCSALNKDETPCDRRGTHADRHNPERYRCAVHHKAKSRSHRRYKALSKKADVLWEEAKNTRGVVDIQASVDLVWLDETRTRLERFHATLEGVVAGREMHTRLFYPESAFEPDENHQKICETLRYRMRRVSHLLRRVERRDVELRAAQAVLGPLPLDPLPHSPPAPVPETSSQPSPTEIESPSLHLDLSQINVPSEDWEEDLDAGVPTLDSPISSYSMSEVSSMPSPSGSQASLLSFELYQDDWPIRTDEDEDQEGWDLDALDNSQQDALGILPSQYLTCVKGGIQVVERQVDNLVPPPPSEGVDMEPTILPGDDLGRYGTPVLEPLEESKGGRSHHERRWMPDPSSLGWGIALTGAVATVAVLNLTMRSRNLSFGRVVKDVARRISSVARTS